MATRANQKYSKLEPNGSSSCVRSRIESTVAGAVRSDGAAGD
jgi:hypothetical protein